MATTKPLLYEDFEPLCKWQRGEANDALEVHLQGFRKEQLRVQIDSGGILTISGERALDDNKWSRFKKEINVTQDYKRNEIQAKFAGEKLIITLPKKIPLIATLVDNTGVSTASGSSGSTKCFVSRLQMSKMKALNVTLGVAVLVCLAVYIYKYCQCRFVEN